MALHGGCVKWLGKLIQSQKTIIEAINSAMPVAAKIGGVSDLKTMFFKLRNIRYL